MSADRDPGDENDADTCSCGNVCKVVHVVASFGVKYERIVCERCGLATFTSTLHLPLLQVMHMHTVTV